MSILFALQVCPVDVPAGMELAQLIADIETQVNHRREWLICYREDTPINRVEKMRVSLSKKFDRVRTARARHFAQGWPAGANALWTSTMLEAAELRQAGTIQCDGVLTFEADCVPMCVDWMTRLETAYRRRRAPIVGNLHRSSEVDAHINGNSIFPINLLALHPVLLKTPIQGAWDFYHRKLLLSLSEDTPHLTQRYSRINLTLLEWRSLKKHGFRPALLHGVKDQSARTLARMDLVAKKGLAPRTKTVLLQVS